MNSLNGKIALVTGASAGIGEATALALAEAGCKIILNGRRQERLTALAQKIKKDFNIETYSLLFDVRDRETVRKAIEELPSPWNEIDILVNSAGLGRGLEKFYEGKFEDWDEMIDTNVTGLLNVSRLTVPGMVARGRGHIVNLGSIAGHAAYSNGNVYCATKYAVRGLSESMRFDLVDTPLRVTSIDPGLVETEFSIVRFRGDKERAKTPYQGIDPLTARDIAETIVFAVTRPAHVNINQITVMATSQASATVIHRKPS